MSRSAFRLIALSSALIFTLNGCYSTAKSIVSGTYDVAAFTVNNKATRAVKDGVVYVGGETLDYATDIDDGLLPDTYDLAKGVASVIAILIKAASKEWGDKNVKQASAKKYVKYTNHYKSRAEVDFDKGQITVETVDEKAPVKSLQDAIVTTLLTPDDPRDVDLYSDKEVKLKGKPYLAGTVKDHQGKVVLYKWRANNYAKYLTDKKLKTKQISAEGSKKKVYYVRIPMVKGHSDIRAKKYESIVNKYARQYGVERALIYAIIKTESNFNPYAVSRVPAYGLMQVVPTSAGRDAHQAIYRKKGTPSKKILFQPERNIHYGVAYLDILFDRYLKEIKNPTSKEYCVISAYNTGSGNVLRTFDRNRKKAVQKINALKPDAVLWKLKTQLPYAETRRYIQKVNKAKREFVGV